jgi:hypothetical protein
LVGSGVAQQTLTKYRHVRGSTLGGGDGAGGLNDAMVVLYLARNAIKLSRRSPRSSHRVCRHVPHAIVSALCRLHAKAM